VTSNRVFAVRKTGQLLKQVGILSFGDTGKESVIYDTQLPEGIDSVQHIQDMEDAAYRSALNSLLLSVQTSKNSVLLCVSGLSACVL